MLTCLARDQRGRGASIWMLVSVLVAVLCGELLERAHWLDLLEHAYADTWVRLAGVRQVPDKVMLVKLDEATLAEYPDEPLAFWTPHFARAAATLRQAGAKVVGFDMLFSATPERWLMRVGGAANEAVRDFDRPFRQELAQGKVVLTGVQSDGVSLLPAPDYLLVLPEFDVLAAVGAADLTPDTDGVMRHFLPRRPPNEGGKENVPLLTLPFLLAVQASGQDPNAAAWHFGDLVFGAESAPVALAYSGPPGTVPALSMRELLQPDALRNPRVQAVKDKVVIIGASYGGMNDVHLTPYGRGVFDAPLMLGVEIQAQTVEALLSGRFVSGLPLWVRGGIALLAALGLVVAAQRLRLSWAFGVALAGMAVLALLGGWLAGLRVQAPVAQWQITGLLAGAGMLARRLTHGERESARVRSIFSRYVEPKVIDALLASERLPQLGGAAAEVTVLFSDIRNFTTLSERMTPEEVVEMLNTYFGRACAVLAEEGGCIDKFIGDAIMVEFGVPLAMPDHARRALRAALRLQVVAEEFRNWMTTRFAGRDLPEFAVGIGVHSGHAVVGNIGGPARMEYTAIGDTVNLASRLEGVTKTMGCTVVASAETVRQAGAGVVRLGRQEAIQVKGKALPVAVWEVLGKQV